VPEYILYYIQHGESSEAHDKFVCVSLSCDYDATATSTSVFSEKSHAGWITCQFTFDFSNEITLYAKTFRLETIVTNLDVSSNIY
jgi:hypothetical protein